MSELVRVAVDAMGGDNAPFVTVKGAVDAVRESDARQRGASLECFAADVF